MWTGWRRDKGFTLLEVMIALAIIATLLVVTLSLRNRHLQLIGEVRNVTVATLLAQEKMTEVELAGFPDLGEGEGSFEKRPGFAWRRRVSPTPFDFVREVEIKVNWGTENAESVRLVSYVFDEK